jgi:peptidylprolyl isomerase
VVSDCIDISPGGDGGIIKRILRRGDPEAGFPRPRDVVELRWVLAHADGTIIRKSEETANPFLHIVGQEESAVIPAWEMAVPTMLQGEVAALIIAPQYGFGADGAPPFVAGNETLLCELHLLAIAPNALRKFQEIGENEDIREQLAESIYDGKSPVSDNVLRNRAVSEHKSATGPGGKPLMFDPSVHNLDPKRQVEGRAEGYRWLETPLLMEVEVDLPPHVRTKEDIAVNLT